MRERRSRNSRDSKIRRVLFNACRCEALDPRRLLTFEFSGTPGDDTIEVQFNLTNQEYRFILNGSLAGTTEDTSVVMWANAGNDYINLKHVPDGGGPGIDGVTVFAGSGDDTLEVGNGFLASNLKGRVDFDGQDGFDEVIVNDGLDNLVPDQPVTFRASSISVYDWAVSGGGAGGGAVNIDTTTNQVSLLSSSSADTVRVEIVPPRLTLALGGGNDTVIYGDDHVLEAALRAGTVDGAAGTDRIVFDDADGPTLEGRLYEFTDDTAMNQALFGVEELEVITRNTGGVGGNTPNSVLFEGGFPVNRIVQIDGGGLGDRTFIGTPTAPIDLDQTLVDVTTTNPGHKEIYDQDFGGHQAAFVLNTGGSPLRQIVASDNFSAEFIPVDFDVNRNIDIHGGSTNDNFGIYNTLAGRNIGIFGGGGDDAVFNVPADLDAVFPSPIFVAGGDGDDSLFLDDSQDQIDDDDHEYRLLPSLTVGHIFDKAGSGGSAGPVINYSDSMENILLAADAGNNTVRFQGLATQHLSIEGGGGNDYITNTRSGQNGSLVLYHPGSAVIVGGAGNDSIGINDQNDSLVSEYELNPSQFQFRSGLNAPRTLGYDGSSENFFLDQNNAATTTRLHGKPAAMRLNVSALGGNDVLIVGGGDIDNSGLSASTTTLLGGAGDDRIEFDDRVDDHNVSDADAFTFEFQRVTKDGVAILYGGFESQKLYTSGVNNSSVLFPYTVRMHGIDMPTEVVGTAGDRDNTVEMGHPTFGISQVTFGTITLNFVAAPAIVNVNDVSAVGRTYRLTATQLFLPSIVNYSGVAGLNIFAGGGADTYNVDALSATTNAFFSGGAGDDLMSLGSGGPIAPIAGRVYVRGNDGDDEFFITNGAGGGFTDVALTGGTVSVNGGPAHLYDTAERMHVIANDSGSSFVITSVSATTTLQGGAGDDAVNVGDGEVSVGFPRGLFVEGNAGDDEIVFDDSTAAASAFETFAFDVDGPYERFIHSSIHAGGAIVFSSGVERRTLHASGGNSPMRVYDTLSPLRINANGGIDSFFIEDAAVPITISGGAGTDYLQLNRDDSLTGGGAPVAVVFEQDEDLGGLSVYRGGTVRVLSGAVLCNLGFIRDTIAEPVIGGTLDLAGGGAAYLGKPADFALTETQVRAMMVRGRNGGAWNGTNAQGLGAIHSTAAAASSIADGVGYGLGSQVGITQIGSFAIGADDVLVRHALDGDADLSGGVDIADFSRVASNFNGTGKVWTSADFNYDNTTDIGDFSSLASNFNQTIASEPPRRATAGAFSGRLIAALEDQLG